ncbi:MAG: hypothetical protein KKH98_03790, partial [Spirochaetes bacterium]|nr:hypothetical protein [Spirochaetota bacterium]
MICYLKIPLIYTQINSLFHPQLKGEPVIIGGGPEEYGIVMEASFPARKRGIRSGMLSSHARQILPAVQFMPPDNIHYEQFIKKIMQIADGFSVKLIKDAYNAFYLFLPDYFHLTRAVSEFQYEIYSKLNIHTMVGLSDNKYVARLAAELAGFNGMLHIDKTNADAVFSDVNVDLIQEL